MSYFRSRHLGGVDFQHDKVRKVPNHTCSLPQEEDSVTLFIDTGYFVQCRRKFRDFLTVSHSNPDSKRILRSTQEIRNETHRHLMYYSHIIHPFSDGRTYWEMFMIPVYILLFILIPVEISTPKVYLPILYSKFALDIISLIDMLLFFFTGYYEKRTGRIILKQSTIIKRYLLSYFVVDFLSSQPISMYIRYTNSHKYFRIKLIMLLKVIRLPTLIQYLHKFCQMMDLWTYYVRIISFGLLILISILFATSVVFFINSIEFGWTISFFQKLEDGIFTPMLFSCFVVVRSFMLVATSHLYIHNFNSTSLNTIFDIILQILLLVVGSVLNIIMLAKIMQIYCKITSSTNKYNNLIQQIDEYMKYKELPTRLRDKVIHYVDFKFQKYIFKEADIINTLSSILKQDLLYHNCQRLVARVDFFKDLPIPVMMRIVTKLRSEIFLPNDVIVQAGITGNAMYFIYTGTVAVYTSTWKEICHLQDGDHFGEISLVINEPRVATVIAVKACEVFRLSRKEFQEAIEPFPELSNKIRVSALQRLESTMKMMNLGINLEDTEQ